MTRYTLIVLFVALCLLSTSVALRGALFRSGRSLIHRQNINPNAEHLMASEKRSPVVELYPVVNDVDPEPFANWF